MHTCCEVRNFASQKLRLTPELQPAAGSSQSGIEFQRTKNCEQFWRFAG